jgi:hypothetical protein
VRALAHRFNPAMAFPTRDVWPVEVRYSWHDGSPLIARVMSKENKVLREYIALANERLEANDWGTCPPRTRTATASTTTSMPPATTGPIAASRVAPPLARHHRQRSRQGPHRPGVPPHPVRPLLLVQTGRRACWRCSTGSITRTTSGINHHEGDWERINVVLRGPSRLTENATFRPAGLPVLLPPVDPRAHPGGAHQRSDPREDHVVVYAGGPEPVHAVERIDQRRQLPAAGAVSRRPAAASAPGARRRHHQAARFMPPRRVQAGVLPRARSPGRGQHPELAWLRLSFFAGQTRMYNNPLAMNGTSFGSAPVPARAPGRRGTASGIPPTGPGDPSASAAPRP